MRELLGLLIVVAAIAIIWYARQKSGGANNGQVIRSRRNGPSAGERASASVPTPGHDAGLPDGRPASAAKSAGLFQDAANSASGLDYERAADRLEQTTAELGNAQRELELAADRLAIRAAEALAAINLAAAAHGGAVPGDGTQRCPPTYPVKATIGSMQYLTLGQPAYDATVPDACLKSAEAALAVGFSERREVPQTGK